MAYLSVFRTDFGATVNRWISERGEVLAMIRYSHCGGSKSFEFFDDAERFRSRMEELEPRTCVIVFGERQLSLRGRIDDEFIRQALDHVVDGTDFLIAGLELYTYGDLFSYYPYRDGVSHDELKEGLVDYYGEEVAVGPYPPWLHDTDEVIEGVIPNADGYISEGAY